MFCVALLKHTDAAESILNFEFSQPKLVSIVLYEIEEKDQKQCLLSTSIRPFRMRNEKMAS